MKRHELVIAFCVAYALMVAGVTWEFGAFGLMGSGVVGLISLFFIDIKEE